MQTQTAAALILNFAFMLRHADYSFNALGNAIGNTVVSISMGNPMNSLPYRSKNLAAHRFPNVSGRGITTLCGVTDDVYGSI